MTMPRRLRPLRTWFASRETAAVKADSDALRSLAEARAAVRNGDVIHGTAAVRALVEKRPDRPS